MKNVLKGLLIVSLISSIAFGAKLQKIEENDLQREHSPTSDSKITRVKKKKSI